MNKKALLQSTILALGLESALQAQTWDYGAATQNWTDALNWSGDVIPQTGVTTVNTATAGQTPIISTAVNLTAFDPFIGDGTAGVLDINSGGSVDTSTKWIFIGHGAGGDGTLNVNSGGTLTSDNSVRVGRAGGTGHLNVNGGTVTVNNISNENTAANTFNFSNAATVTTVGGTSLRNLTLTDITGNISLQGGDQFLAAGSHKIASGGSFDTSGQLFIGNGITNALTVDAGAGSVNAGSWLPVGIGNNGNGTLNLDSGTINASDISGTAFTTVGANNNAIGVITQNGGIFNQGGAGIVLGEGGTAQGTYNLNGGDLNTKRIWSNNGNANLNLNGGTLHATADNADFITANVSTDVQAGGANIDTNSFNVTVAADLIGVGALDKQGAGSLTLAGAGNSVGSVTVSAGTLYVTGALATTAGTTIGSTASIAAGDLSGDTITGDLFLSAGATIDITNGLLTVDSGSTVSFGGFGFSDITGFDVLTAAAGTYTILDGAFTLDSSNISNFGLANALDLGGGKSAYFQEGSLSVVVIPEPGAAILGSLGALALLRRRRPAGSLRV